MLLISLAASAFACSFAIGGEHVVTPNPEDVTAPTAPLLDEVKVTRGVGPECVGPICSFTSCDDLGRIGLAVEAATDDVSAPENIGYRLRVVEGSGPDGLTIRETRRADSLSDGGLAHLALIWGDDDTDEQEPFDFVLGITAVDEAGNESEELTVEISDPGRSAMGCATVHPAGGFAFGLALALAATRRRR